MTNKLNYDPTNLLDALIEKLNLRNDAALAKTLEVAPPVISKLRHCRLPVGASMLIRMEEATGMSIKHLRALMGDHREHFSSASLIASAFHGVDIDACHKKAA